MNTVLQDRKNMSWLQVQDSPGAHKAAIITPGSAMKPLKCSWQAQKRVGINPQTGKPWDWDNVYIYQATTIEGTSVTLDIGFRFATPGDYHDANCFEFEMQKRTSNKVFNGGLQARFDAKEWFAFNFGAKDWQSLGVPIVAGDFDTPATVLTHITAQYQIVEAGLQYVGLCVNGNNHALTYVDAAVVSEGADYLNYAWQLDSRGQGAQINCELWGYNVLIGG